MMTAALDEALADGPLVVFEFEEPSGLPQDSSGNGRHVTSTAGSTGSLSYQEDGLIVEGGYALGFSGNQGLRIAYATWMTTQTVWVELRATIDATSAYRSLVARRTGNGASGNYWQFRLTPTNQLEALVWSSSLRVATTTSTLSAGTYTLAYSYDGRFSRFYVDGSLFETIDHGLIASLTATSGNTEIAIGAWGNNNEGITAVFDMLSIGGGTVGDVPSSTRFATRHAVYTNPPPPGEPENLSETHDYESITLEWDPPSSGPTPEGYEVRIDGGTPVDVGTDLDYEWTDLYANIEYEVEVRAYNSFGFSSWVGLQVETDHVDPPGVPTTVASPDHSHYSVTLSWSAPDSGGPVRFYEVRINGGTPSTATSPHEFTGLADTTTYTVEVRAVGPGGPSSWVAVQVTTDDLPEVAPGGLTSAQTIARDRRTLQVKVDGEWLHLIAPYGPITVTYGEHGLDAVSWQMRSNFRHPLLRGGRLVELFDGGFLLGHATLREPGFDGSYYADGWWRQAVAAPCVDTLGGPTVVADAALAGALARGEISWTVNGFSNTALAADADPSSLSLADLLRMAAAAAGKSWRVSAAGVLEMVQESSAPRWVVPSAVAGRGLAPAEDEFYTHVEGTYVSSGGLASAIVGDDDAAGLFRRRTLKVDLTILGEINSGQAEAVLTGILGKVGVRMGWSEGLELGYRQITNTGGVPAPLSHVTTWDVVQLVGVLDLSRPALVDFNTHITALEVTYTDGSGLIQIKPKGYAPRNIADIQTAALNGGRYFDPAWNR